MALTEPEIDHLVGFAALPSEVLVRLLFQLLLREAQVWRVTPIMPFLILMTQAAVSSPSI